MKITKIFLTMTGLLAAQWALGSEIMMHSGSILTVPINSQVGTVLEFPASIQLTVPSKKFSVKQIATQMDQKTKQAVNIRFLSIKPLSGAAIDTINVVFPNMRSVKIRLMTTAGADKHHLFIFPNKRGKTSWSGDTFLEDEIKMMVSMMRDEGNRGFEKNVVERPIRISGYDDIELILVRQFQGKGLLGYVFKLVNSGKEAITINPAALNFDSPNRAALFQIDHTRLEPCSVNNSSNPREPSCAAAVRLVVRGNHYLMPASKSDLPFRMNRG